MKNDNKQPCFNCECLEWMVKTREKEIEQLEKDNAHWKREAECLRLHLIVLEAKKEKI